MGRYGIVGLGPSGGIAAAHLAVAGHEVVGADVWREHREAIAAGGVVVEGHRELRSPPIAVVASAAELAERELDAVVVAVKTPYLAEVVDALRPLAGRVPVVVYQNGLGNERWVARRLGCDRVLRVAINYAGVPRGPGRIEMTFFHPPNQIGCLCGEGVCADAGRIAADLTGAGLDTEATQDIARFTWRKTILNAALSPLSALLGMTMAEVMGNPDSRGLVEALLAESIEVARAAGYDFGEGFLDACIGYLAGAGHHRPSMLVDLESGRPTEIGFINGGIAARARELGVPAPLNAAMTALVRAREAAGRGR